MDRLHSAQPHGVSVIYTGKETPFVDRLYGSGLTFDPLQVRSLPGELAQRLLRHSDVFQPAPEQNSAKVKASAVDDTAELLEQAAKAKAIEDTDSDRTQDVIDQLGDMDKDALQDFAQVHYGQNVPKNLSVENMRTRVADMVRQYGKP